MTDYYAYWGLKQPPFTLTPDPAKLFLSKQHSECLLRLKYAVTSNKGGALLISQNAGDGKTSVLNLLTAELAREYPDIYKTAFVSHPTLTPRQMIAEIARQTGCDIRRRDKMRTLNDFRDYLSELAKQNMRALVIVDEGQMLARRPDVLDELRILLNFCVEDRFLLSFVLSGQLPLEKAVRSMPEFWQRLPVRFFLASHPGRTFTGRVERVAPAAELIDDKNVVMVRVRPDRIDVPLKPNIEARAKIACGQHVLGYVWFREVIHFFQTRVLF